jgi:hypothetical protein
MTRSVTSFSVRVKRFGISPTVEAHLAVVGPNVVKLNDELHAMLVPGDPADDALAETIQLRDGRT